MIHEHGITIQLILKGTLEELTKELERLGIDPAKCAWKKALEKK